MLEGMLHDKLSQELLQNIVLKEGDIPLNRSSQMYVYVNYTNKTTDDTRYTWLNRGDKRKNIDR